MAKALLFSSSSLLPALPRAGGGAAGLLLPLWLRPGRRRAVRVGLHGLDSLGVGGPHLQAALYTLADAAAGGGDAGQAATAVQKNGGWFGFISEAVAVSRGRR